MAPYGPEWLAKPDDRPKQSALELSKETESEAKQIMTEQ